ncbi:MAG: rhamnulokinase [Candidatus Promineifilaceae bacterium]|jgi:rhamnulokinase
MTKQTVLTVDLGAESGRVMAVSFDGRRLSTNELRRFPNPLTTTRGTTHWDFLHIWREIQAGIEAGKELHPASIGVDTWGVDFALLDNQGHLIGNPVSYRDDRTEGMMEAVFERVPRSEVFAKTGIQIMRINTLYQLMSLLESRSPQLSIAGTLLMAPDLINYWLTGVKVCEFTDATTTQMFNPQTGTWAFDLLDSLGLPGHILPEIVPPGTRLGDYHGIQVIAPACHDTGSAVAAVPTTTEAYAYISSGTWSLVGQEIERPIINEKAMAANVTNEGGVYGTYRLLRNITGLWLVQQSRRTWASRGDVYSYGELVELARKASPLVSLVDPNDAGFLPAGDHPLLVQNYCANSGQVVPVQKGAILRTILESLALSYRGTLETLADLSGQEIEAVHIVGGGSQNELLNQMTADATGIPVVAGPVEATVLGNALVQLITLGEIDDLAQGRQVVAESEQVKRYEPQQSDAWEAAYGRLLQLSGSKVQGS